jgi:hypothetical protein
MIPKGEPTNTMHNNRAGHRFYVKVFQTRNNRLHLLGWGQWRRHKTRAEESVALQTARPMGEPRAARRAEMIATDRAFRRARGRRITP